MVIAVFEDNRDYAARLEEIIRRYTHYPTAVNTGEAEEIIAFARQAQGSALYILDIVKGDRSDGFRIAEQITALDSGGMIVFLTAYPQRINYNAYYKTKAFSCIYKSNPSMEQELCETIRLAQQALSGKCLLIHAGRFETMYIPYERICYIEAVKGTRKVCIHARDGQYIIQTTLGKMAWELAEHGFVRCHRSILLNTNQEMQVDRSSKAIYFPNGASCPYSDSWRRWMK